MPQVGINSNLIIVPLAEIGRRFSRSDLPLTTSQVLQSLQIPHAQMGMWPGVFIFLPRLVDPSPFKVDDKLPKGIKVQQSPEGVINPFKSKYAVNTSH